MAVVRSTGVYKHENDMGGVSLSTNGKFNNIHFDPKDYVKYPDYKIPGRKTNIPVGVPNRSQGVFTNDEMLKRREMLPMDLQGEVVSPNAVDARTHQIMISNAERLSNIGSYKDFVEGMKNSAMDVMYPNGI